LENTFHPNNIKDELRNHLLNGRASEFYGEVGIRREDQIRMGTFIFSAIERGHANANLSGWFFLFHRQP
jgi:hypothetical protein